jgi:predicted ATP-dependent endonuclease of OLD family
MFNVVKSPAPTGPINYTHFEIADQVKRDFHYKCYLCEESVARHLEIDHFYPASVFEEKKHDWYNLFSSCTKCNKIKSAAFNATPESEILNCCTEDIEQAMVLRYNIIDASIAITGRADTKVANTIDLLNHIHNGIGTSSHSFLYLRETIAEALSDLRKVIDAYYTFPSATNKQRIAELISRKATFTAIKRSLIIDYNPEFTELFD